MSELNFEDDLKSELLKMSELSGFRISSNKNVEHTLIDYLTIKLKLINPQPRVVRLNPNLKPRISNHPQAREIMALLNLARDGGNLNIFQSKRLIQSNFHDHLLNEWKIFHFHLSLDKDKKSGFVKQVNSLLFAYVDDEQVIFLDTDKHTDGVFADTKWIEILHDHFPEVISRYRDDSIKDVHPKVSASERQTLWNKGYTLGMTKIRDVVYFSPGIGRSTSGHGFEVTELTNKIMRWLFKVKTQVNDHYESLCQVIGVQPEKASFKVQFGENALELTERFTEYKVLEYPQSIDIDKLNSLIYR